MQHYIATLLVHTWFTIAVVMVQLHRNQRTIIVIQLQYAHLEAIVARPIGAVFALRYSIPLRACKVAALLN